MTASPSSHFTALSLEGAFNRQRETLEPALRLEGPQEAHWYDRQNFRGIPFSMGQKDQPNVIFLDRETVIVDVEERCATYLLFLHTVTDRMSPLPADLQDCSDERFGAGNLLGDLVSEYRLDYADGSSEIMPIRRRFEIQQAHPDWGANPFAAKSVYGPRVTASSLEAFAAGRKPLVPYGEGETRHTSGRDLSYEHIWIYALPNPSPEKVIRRIALIPGEEQSAIFAISLTDLTEHPLRAHTRQKLRLILPENLELPSRAEANAFAEAVADPVSETVAERVDIDLGTVISVQPLLAYDRTAWHSTNPDVQPERTPSAVLVEYVAHPAAKLYLKTGPRKAEVAVFDLADIQSEGPLVEISPAVQPVHLRIVERGSHTPVPVRLHLHGAEGEYLPPKGHHRRVNPGWFEDNYGEFVNGLNQYCYIPGECVVDLPQGEVFVEITRGYEVKPIRTSFEVTADTREVTFELERVLRWREQGWVAADTHVHFLSPQTALLEGSAEGVHVVNLLASQWGEMFSNVSDFDGSTTFGARELGGSGDFLVRVGTENRMQVLGHISLLGYAGSMIQPLCSGGPSESALGDPLEVTMADWARQCIDQNGLVVMPHGPNPQCERAADIVLGLVHAVEMMTFNPFDAQITPYGIADWYRYLNLGYHLPLVGGSDKMSAASLLGGIRTYALLGKRAFTYENWMQAVREGNTFVTVGPLATFTVDGKLPGQRIRLPPNGGTVDISWTVESAMLPLERVEIVVGGLTAEQIELDGQLSASGHFSLSIDTSTWIALRVRGSYRQKSGDIAAHTSALQVMVGEQPLFSQPDAIAVLEQIEGALAYVDTLAPRPEARRFKQVRATLEAAYTRLHMRLHQQGILHKHAPVYEHREPDAP